MEIDKLKKVAQAIEERINELRTSPPTRMSAYGQIHHRGILRMGWKLEPMLAAKFQMFARDNMPYLNKTYFEF